MSWDPYSAPFKVPSSPSPGFSLHRRTLYRDLHQGAPSGFFVSLQKESLHCLPCCPRPEGPRAPESHTSQLISLSICDMNGECPVCSNLGRRHLCRSLPPKATGAGSSAGVDRRLASPDQPMSPYHLTPDPRSCSPMRSVCKLALPRTHF